MKPSTAVKTDSVILELSNPQLDQELRDAELKVQAAEASGQNLRVQAQNDYLQQKAATANIGAEYNKAKMQAEMNEAQHSAWETIQRAHAIANGIYVIVVNRVGREGKLNFWGQSFVADPFGRLIAKASADKEEVLVVDCDLNKMDETRQNWPFLRDRRIDAYQGLQLRYGD